MPKVRGGYSFGLSLVVLLLVIGLVGFFHSPFFTVQSIQVSGSSYTMEKIADLAGIKVGTSLLKLDVEMAMRLLEQEPIISRAIVRRHLPDTILIEVEEYTPVAMVSVETGFWGVAVDGTLLGRIDLGGISLPVITGVNSEFLTVGSKNVSELMMAANIINGLPQMARDRISEVNVRDRDGLRVISRNLVEFYLGDLSHLAEKLDAVVAFLANLESGQLPPYTVVDLVNPKRPVVRKLQ
jgi:cell division protein FtsQ